MTESELREAVWAMLPVGQWHRIRARIGGEGPELDWLREAQTRARERAKAIVAERAGVKAP